MAGSSYHFDSLKNGPKGAQAPRILRVGLHNLNLVQPVPVPLVPGLEIFSGQRTFLAGSIDK